MSVPDCGIDSLVFKNAKFQRVGGVDADDDLAEVVFAQFDKIDFVL